MANEAVIVELLGNQGDPIEYTVADDTTIAKGTILRVGDPRIASASSTAGQIPIGIAAAEKLADDGATTIAVYTNGIFDLLVDGAGACSTGEKVVIAGANEITRLATTGLEPDDAKLILGTALESGSAEETIQVRVLL